MRANRWTIDNFIDESLCKSLIEHAENVVGFEQATLDTSAGVILRLEYRNNDRATFDDFELAKTLWEKIEGDPRLENPGWTPIGLNERFKIYRYTGKDQYFAQHFDGSFERIPMQEQSWVTVLVYLNEGFEGGETSFIDGDIVPETGLAAFFTQHNYLHEGREVPKGTKYVLRTDVMYRRKND